MCSCFFSSSMVVAVRTGGETDFLKWKKCKSANVNLQFKKQFSVINPEADSFV